MGRSELAPGERTPARWRSSSTCAPIKSRRKAYPYCRPRCFQCWRRQPCGASHRRCEEATCLRVPRFANDYNFRAAGNQRAWHCIVHSSAGARFLPARRSERALEHAPDAHSFRTGVESHGLPIQRALPLGRAVALTQIIEPGRAVLALGPEFGIGNITSNRPAIGTVALAK